MFRFIKGFTLFFKKVAVFQTIIILTIVYILIAPIFAFIFLLIGKNKYEKTGWLKWGFYADSIIGIKKQF